MPLALTVPCALPVLLALVAIRTGVKVAVVDPTGKLLATETIYPHPPRKQWDESIAMLAKLIEQYKLRINEKDEIITVLKDRLKDMK